VSITIEPGQKSKGPEAVIANGAGAASTDTLTGEDVTEQFPWPTAVTLYVPESDTVILAVVAPSDQTRLPFDVAERTTFPP
jgi:hypothetical protein